MARIALFLYGLVVYAFFFATFMYFFGFASGLLVPRHVDSGEAGPVWLAAPVDLGLVFLFGAQHAVMARPGFKRWWTRIVPHAAERSTFVLVATALLALLMWQWRPIPAVLWDVQFPAARIAIYGVFTLGVAIVLLSSFLIDHFDLFGLRQVFLHLRRLAYSQQPFVLRSLYKLVRHPLMVGFLIAFWAAPTMTAGHLLFAAAFTAYIMVGVRMEERDLVAQHGESYMAYQRSTPRFVPRLRKRVFTQEAAPAQPLPEIASPSGSFQLASTLQATRN